MLGRWECSAMSAGSWEFALMHFNAFGSFWRSNEECKNYQRLSIESDPKESDAKCEVESHQPSSKLKQRDFVSLMKRLEKNQRS